MYKKTKVFTGWISNLVGEYLEYTKKSAPHRCKVIGLETDIKTAKTKFVVKLQGIKSQVSVSYFPEELITNDALLSEFSQTDVRAITFYAINNAPRPIADNEFCYQIVGQEFANDKTIFIINKLQSDGEIRKTALELYSNAELLKRFKFDDMMSIIQTAVQEQTIEDIR